MKPATHLQPPPFEAPHHAAPALDAGAIAHLRELDPTGRSGVVQRVLMAYESSLQRVLALIQVEAEKVAPNPQVLLDNAHMLKSSSKSVGALDLAGLCEAMEMRIRTTDQVKPDDAGRLMAEMDRALVAVRAELRA